MSLAKCSYMIISTSVFNRLELDELCMLAFPVTFVLHKAFSWDTQVLHIKIWKQKVWWISWTRIVLDSHNYPIPKRYPFFVPVNPYQALQDCALLIGMKWWLVSVHSLIKQYTSVLIFISTLCQTDWDPTLNTINKDQSELASHALQFIFNSYNGYSLPAAYSPV